MSMRQGGQNRRSRNGRSNGKRPFSSHGGGGGGGGGGGSGGGLNRSFESNGPGVKLRGTAAQVYDKYLALARDASSAGDRVAAENYFQHAEHYYRILSANQAQNAQAAQQNGQPGNRPQGGQPNPQGGGYSRATPADPNRFDGDAESEADEDQQSDQPQMITSETPQPI